jgi:hypothetical protein
MMMAMMGHEHDGGQENIRVYMNTMMDMMLTCEDDGHEKGDMDYGPFRVLSVFVWVRTAL